MRFRPQHLVQARGKQTRPTLSWPEMWADQRCDSAICKAYDSESSCFAASCKTVLLLKLENGTSCDMQAHQLQLACWQKLWLLCAAVMQYMLQHALTICRVLRCTNHLCCLACHSSCTVTSASVLLGFLSDSTLYHARSCKALQSCPAGELTFPCIACPGSGLLVLRSTSPDSETSTSI